METYNFKGMDNFCKLQIVNLMYGAAESKITGTVCRLTHNDGI